MTEMRLISELLEALRETPRGSDLFNVDHNREQLYRELAEDQDPLLREIGQQLRDGLIRPHELLTIPGYDLLIEERLNALREANPDEVRSEVASYLTSLLRQARAGDGREAS